MGYNDRHFTRPDPSPGQSMEHYQNDVAFRQQLASVFPPYAPHNVRMESGHFILPDTHADGSADAVISHHNDPYGNIRLPLGSDPSQWMGNLAKHLNSRDVMGRMHEQMQKYGDE
jgi:hypothetical protein